jgi:hypothetical protein
MTKYTTVSGSIYLVDEDKKMVTRVIGKENPTTRQGEDCVWKEYKKILHTAGGSIFFDWTGQGNGTMTSQILLVEEQEEKSN